MAVYTKITQKILLSFLKNYELGMLVNFKGIQEGVENTNYKITTSKKNYILTIFEKRVNENELPFFIELQNHLSNKNIKCPKPIADQNNNYINKIENKSCVVTSFLPGKKIEKVTIHHCHQVGEQLAKMHLQTSDFSLTRENSLNQKNWRNIFEKCKKIQHDQYDKLFEIIENNLRILENKWPIGLPKGVIHADVFQDNVFFIDGALSGLIDFYFACNDFYAYELAICINAWCFDKEGSFDQAKYNSIIQGYQNLRKLTLNELKYLDILLIGAAMRFLLTRLHDKLYHNEEAFVNHKDPLEYFKILKYHQNSII